VLLVKGVIEGKGYPWPCGVYVDSPETGFEKIQMAMETRVDGNGAHWEVPKGTDQEMADLKASYEHLTKLRDETIEMGSLPPLDKWLEINPKLGRTAGVS